MLLTPLKGWAGPLDEAPDAVFAERMLGDGVAIDPTGETLHAPCDGEVLSVARTRHAVTLRADNGAEILIHIGLETVALGGEGFTAHVRAGQRVQAGDLLIGFDIDLLARRAKSLLTPVLVTNSDAFAILHRTLDREVDVGEPLMELKPLDPEAGGAKTVGEEFRRGVTLGLPHGLHARPAGRIAALIKPFAAEISLLARGRDANARSPVALLTLGVGHGDEVVLSSRGADAAAALDVLASYLESDGGETTPTGRALPTAAVSASGTSASVTPGVPVDGILKGVRAAPGHAIGPAFQLRRAEIIVREAGSGVAAERAALNAALRDARTGLCLPQDSGAAGEIMAAHLALLDDPDLRAAAEALIGNGKSAGFAWARALDVQADVLRRLDDPRLRERANDLVDLKRRVLANLGGARDAEIVIPDDAILLADDLLPSELMALGGRISGLCTAAGGPTSHVAIIAAALNIPAVTAAGPGVLAIADGVVLILDAGQGTLRMNPAPAELARAREVSARRAVARDAAKTASSALCRTADGTRIEVFANLSGVAEAASAVAEGAEGCGLLRSEFLFMDRTASPDEEEQRCAYQAVADGLGGRPLIIRTLDIGGDKPVAYLSLPKEVNPALGLRGVRVSLLRPDLLRTQLRAILRVVPAGVCRIMAPMVASVEELIAVRRALDAERAALAIHDRVELGVMIETPAAAVTAAAIAAEADFLSIGTNDLTQYALAMDRTNPALAAGVDALHPAVLRLIALICEGANAHDRPVGVCGGLASEPSAAALLIGLGVTELSAAPSAIPALKAAIRSLRMDACRALASEALGQTSAAAVRALLSPAFDDPILDGAAEDLETAR
jgi:phosphoenolpyruvate-protein phosphotransferase